MPKPKRTIQQNKALHKYFSLVAEALNDAGLDMRAVLKPDVEIPWTGNNVKEFMWKPVQKLALGKEHTADLDKTGEIDNMYDIFNRHIAKFGIHVEFPTDKQMKESELLAAMKIAESMPYPKEYKEPLI